MWTCCFCGESCSLRSIRQHLTKLALASGRKGGGCPEVTIETLQEFVGYGIDEADSKLQAIEAQKNAPPAEGSAADAEVTSPKPKKRKEAAEAEKTAGESKKRSRASSTPASSSKADDTEKKDKKDKKDKK